jgi:hypothetical protein
MRAISTETIILLGAVVLVGALIVIFWSWGINPLFGQASKADCESKVREMCDHPTYDVKSIPSSCPPYFKQLGGDTRLKECIDSSKRDSLQCEDFCNWFKTEYLGQG